MPREKDQTSKRLEQAKQFQERQAEARAKAIKPKKWKYTSPKINIFKEPASNTEKVLGLGLVLAVIALVTYLAFPNEVTCARDALLSFEPTIQAIQLLISTLPACFR